MILENQGGGEEPKGLKSELRFPFSEGVGCIFTILSQLYLPPWTLTYTFAASKLGMKVIGIRENIYVILIYEAIGYRIKSSDVAS